MNKKTRIKEVLNGLKIKDLARQIKSDRSVATIENYLHQAIAGTRTLPNFMIYEICRITGSSADYLLGISEDKESFKMLSDEIGVLSKNLREVSKKLEKKTK